MTGREPSGRRLGLVLLGTALLSLAFAMPFAAEEQGKPVADAPADRQGGAPEPRLADLGPQVPRGALREYLDACRAGDYVSAAKVLDLSFLPGSERAERGPDLARHLKVVLDQKLWVDYGSLSVSPDGHPDDGLAADVDRVGVIETSRGEVPVLMQRVGEPGAAVWKISSSTVELIPVLYSQFGYGPLGEVLPEELFEIRFFEIELWQWIGLFLLIVLALAAAWVAVWVLVQIVRPIVRRTRSQLDDRLVELVTTPLRMAVALVLFSVGSLVLRLSAPVHEFLRGLEKGLAVVVVTWLLMRVVHVVADELTDHLRSGGRDSVIAMMPLGRKTVKVVLVVLAFIAMLQNLGFNVTGLIAGLGVGGLAVALAAQKTVENLFGGVTLAADQPVRVGEFCKFGDQVGTVEDVGLRSTRVRTLDRTLVTIPNAEFSQMKLENFAKRDRIRLYTVIGVRYETTPDQLRYMLTEIRKMLAAHPMVHPEPARIRFVGFGAYSLDLEVFAYVLTQDFNEFLKVREDIFLRLMDIVEESGSGFAFPSQTMYLGRDGGLDRPRQERAEKEVRLWREAGRLPFPDLSPEMVAEIEDGLDYPPKGSPSEARDS